MRIETLIGAGCLLLVAAGAQAQTVPVRQPLSLAVGESPFDLLVADVNGDHHLDIVSTNFVGQTITVQLGSGTGEFTELDEMPASTAPIKVAPLFADPDTNLDLVVSEGESDFIYILHGNGDGTFQEPVAMNAGHDPYALVIADMNKDGHDDIIETLASETGGRVNVLLGDGEGNFALTEDNGRRVNAQSYGVAVGDFDEDGKLDVAATTLGRPTLCDLPKCGTLAVMIGGGNGQLAAPANLATGSTPFPIASADVDKDGHLDILTGDSGDSMVSFFKGDGHGNFARTQRVGVGNTPGSITLIDVDGDTRLDVVVGNVRSGDITVLHNLPDGTLAEARHFLSGVMVNAAGAGDFNEDERVDLAGVNEGDSVPSASVLLARPEGGYSAVQSVMPTLESAGIAAGDVRGEGAPALGLSVTAASSVQMFYPEGVQRFRGPIAADAQVHPTLAALRDLDGDGKADLVVGAASEPRLSVALSTGGDTFAAAKLVDIAGSPTGLAVADIDGDGHLDLAATIGTPPAVSILYGNGDGTFAASAETTLTGRPGNVAVGDFNHDGLADLAVGNAQTAAVALILGDAGRNPSSTSLTVNAAPGNVACADFDSDGNDDLVVTAGNTLRVFFGDGAGGFAPGAQLQSGRPASGLAARDVTGDLRPDVLATLQGTNNMAVFVNRGERGFAPSEELLLGLRPGGIAVADFDADGRYDIAVSGSSGWVLTGDGENAVLRGDGNGDLALSVADHLALQIARSRGGRVEDIRRGSDVVNAGADANGDGLLDEADARLISAKVFH